MNITLKIKWLFGIVFSLIGILAFIISCIPLLLEFYNGGHIALSTIISISPYFSSSLAFLAIGFALSSDMKMDINSNEAFLRIVDKFEDKRIDLFQHNAVGRYDLIIENCWKLRTYMERAVKLYEMANIDKDNIKTFFNQLKQLMFWSEMPWHGGYVQTINRRGQIARTTFIIPMRRTDVNNVYIIAKEFRKFYLNEVQKTRLEAYIEFLEYLLDTYYLE